MKHAFLLSTAAVACVACASVGWAQPSGQDRGAPQGGQHSNHQAAANVGRVASAPRGRQATAQSASSTFGRSWTGATMRGPVTGAASVQSRRAPHYAAQSAPRGPQYGAARAAPAVVGATRATSTYAQGNVSGSHRNVQASQRFSAGSYRPPMGYVSRNWNYGQYLPAAYYARGYWINDYLLYALYGPPSGFVWVRVGDDALLINRYTGEVVAVETGVFY